MTESETIDLFPVLNVPVPVIAPEVPYDRLLVWLAMSPRIDGTVVDATASIQYQPYRVLADGSIDVAPDSLRQTYNIGSVIETVATDPAMAQAITGIAAILQQMLADG